MGVTSTARSGAVPALAGWLVTALIASAFSAGGPAALAAQDPDMDMDRALRHRLTVAELDALIPHLEARLAAWTGSSVSITEAAAAHTAYGARWRGGEDPLPFLKGLVDELPLPPGATYAAECSRGLTTLNEQPIAIYTFGVQAAEVDLAGLGLSDWKPRGAGDMGITPQWERVDSIQKAGVYFYASRGWTMEDDVGVAPGERLSVMIERTNSGALWTLPARSYSSEPEVERLQARVHGACAAAGWGPSLRLWAPNETELGLDTGVELNAEPTLSAQMHEAYFALVVAARGLEDGLNEAALAEALEEARQLAAILGDPSHIEVERVRQANLAIYRRHPQLNRLQSLISRLEGW
jgi:hypothetical protein